MTRKEFEESLEYLADCQTEALMNKSAMIRSHKEQEYEEQLEKLLKWFDEHTHTWKAEGKVKSVVTYYEQT